MINFSYILVILILALDLALGLIVYLRNRKDIINRTFFWVSFWTAVWIASNFLENEPFYRDYGPLLLKIDFASAFLLAYYFFFFCVIFSKGISLSLFKKLTLILIPVVFSILSFSPFIIKNIDFYDNTIKFERGVLYWIYAVVLISYIIVGCLNLIIGFRKSKGLERIQTLYILSGFSLSAILAITTNLILTQLIPLSTEINRIGIYGILFFIVFTAYAIIKHHLLNIKVIATEFLVGLVTIVLLIELFLSKSFSVVILKFGILIVFVYLGISLIKSVLKEIKYREEIRRAYEVEKRAHEQIKKAYDVEKKGREVEKKAIKELKRLDDAKDQFMMATQHHLRTPLTSMVGYIELILEGRFGKVPENLKEIIHRFHLSTNRLNKIVNEFLDVNQFQLGKKVVVPRPNMDMREILKEVVEELKFGADSKKIYLKIENLNKVPSKANVDPEKLKAALSNIVDNAIKYTRQGGVTITCERIDGRMRIIVKDTGFGMTDFEQKDMFTRTFERGEIAKKSFTTGRGIGLFIASQIIKAHEGKIWAESEGRDKGSTFYIELPIS